MGAADCWLLGTPDNVGAATELEPKLLLGGWNGDWDWNPGFRDIPAGVCAYGRVDPLAIECAELQVERGLSETIDEALDSVRNIGL